jgi:uncharacterized protein YggE
MMMKSILTFLTLFIFSPAFLHAQVGGNQIYTGNSTQIRVASPSSKQSIQTTDSTLVINASILLNQLADQYMVSVGVQQEAENPLASNKKINERIDALQKSLKQIKVQPKDIYVDFVSQTRVYDYKVDGNQAQQIETGFEIKKNVIIRLDDINLFDRLVELCAEQEIYDIIKVEYISKDVDAIYNQLFTEAVKMIEARKKLYLSASNVKLTGVSRISDETFSQAHPKTGYQEYRAFETSQLNIQNNYNNRERFIQQEARKLRTFYYEGLDASGFDKVINEADPRIGIQYAFHLSIWYELEK